MMVMITKRWLSAVLLLTDYGVAQLHYPDIHDRELLLCRQDAAGDGLVAAAILLSHGVEALSGGAALVKPRQ